MAKSLVIVESPAKAKTIGKYLGKQFVVKASLGHVKDLPKKDLSVDVDKNFEPHYEVIEGKKKLMAELRAAAGLERDVMLLGMATHFELWDLARLAEQERSQLAQALPESAASFSF